MLRRSLRAFVLIMAVAGTLGASPASAQVQSTPPDETLGAARWQCFTRYFESELQRYGLNSQMSQESSRLSCGGSLGTLTISLRPAGSADCARVSPIFYWNPSNSSSFVRYTGQYCPTGGVVMFSRQGGTPPPLQVAIAPTPTPTPRDPAAAPRPAPTPAPTPAATPAPAPAPAPAGLAAAEVRSIQRNLRALQFADMSPDGAWSVSWSRSAQSFLRVYAAGRWSGGPDVNLLNATDEAVRRLDAARERAQEERCRSGGQARTCATAQ